MEKVVIILKPDNVRILEGKSLLWDDITKAYKRKIDSSDYIVMHQFDEKVLKGLLDKKPFFSEYYVVELHIMKVNTKLFNIIRRYCTCDWICFIFICSVKDDYDAISQIGAKSFNGYKIPEGYWCGYVKSRTNVSSTVNLTSLYKALAGRFELTDILIDFLNKNDGNISLKQFNKLVGKREIMTMDMLWFSILSMDLKRKGDVFKYLESYRYGYRFLHTSLFSKYKETLEIYADFHDGKFNTKNFREYKKDKHLSEWKLNMYLSIFSTVSFDELLLIGEVLECVDVNSTTDIFVLVGGLYKRDFKRWCQ